MIETAIHTILANHQPLATLVDDNIDPDRASNPAAGAYVVYHIITSDPVNMKKSVSTAEIFRIQVDSYASTKLLSASIAKAVKTALEATTGSFAGINISQIKYLNYNGDFSHSPEIFKSSADFMVRVQNN
jgi:hypothetical protein